MKKKTLPLNQYEKPKLQTSTPPASVSKTGSGVKAKGARKSLEKSESTLVAEALILLGVHPNDLDQSPKIEHLFKGIGGKLKVFEYLAGSEEKEAREILDLRKRLNTRQAEVVPFEAYCLAASIPVKKMFGIISSEVMDQESKAKELMFRARHTEVVQATIESALDPLGQQDRKMLHQAAGFVPVPKNSITHIHGNQITDNRQLTATSVTVLPPVEDTVKRLGDRFNDRILDVKALPAAPQEPEDDEEDNEDGDE